MKKNAIKGSRNRQVLDGNYYDIDGRDVTINDTAIVTELIDIIKQLLAERERYVNLILKGGTR